jgi:hypothetical protein
MTTIEYLQFFATRDIILRIIADTGEDIETAMNTLYTSPFFGKLQNPETGLYRKSAGYLYDLFRTGNFNTPEVQQ